jgi:hypothetical protein
MGIITASLQANGKKFSCHLWLYMDSGNSMPVGAWWQSIRLWTPSEPRDVWR